MQGLHKLSASEALVSLNSGQITSEMLVRACIERIEERDGQLGAWEYFNPQDAIRQARAVDRAPRRGLLCGLPIAVKDLIDTVDMPTSYGSSIYHNHRPASDAACISICRDAGAVILGKTRSTEFGSFYPTLTVNPHHPQYSPGGSSSGSAAAVADYMVPLAFGTQTAGSIVRPAAFCGIVGYKPTYSTICRAGVKPLSDSLDTVGILSRTVTDASLLAAVASGRIDLLIKDEDSLPRPIRIGVCHTHEWNKAAPETVAAIEQAIGALSRAGALISDVRLPEEFAELTEKHTEIMQFEMAQALSYERIVHGAAINPRLSAFLQKGLELPTRQFDHARRIGRACRMKLAGIFADYDVMIAPSAVGEAPRKELGTGDPVFCQMWTLLHVPCIHLPFASGPNGLPVGMQVIGGLEKDAELLFHANWIHKQIQ